ncbi:hypothetical protein FE254_10175 [Ectopseudomonas guguanensis]|uniref:GSCFA domain-containing protein n=1 Tax=Ectopseudomonas guguanensis TaxID=1198456 RepID=UPI002576BF33|nr:GSCFA domain-containing protein [Pseudomonas guguanensis]WJH56520.1 hypothetical protein FE254_10175 [Pseudomonas guguanensis]
MKGMISDVTVTALQYRGEQSLAAMEPEIIDSNLIVVMSTFHNDAFLWMSKRGLESKVRVFPHLIAWHFHPDIVAVHHKDGGRVELLGSPDHSLMCIYGWLKGVDGRKLLHCYNERNFSSLGFYSLKQKTDQWLLEQERKTGYSIVEFDRKWSSHGAWVYSPNHPRSFVYADIIRQFAGKNSLTLSWSDAPDFIFDRGSAGMIWPVYPEVAKQFGLSCAGGHGFKLSDKFSGEPGKVISLEEYIEAAYKFYDAEQSNLDFSAAQSRISDAVLSFGDDISSAKNPYLGLDDSKFWKRSVSKLAFDEVDPVVCAKFIISHSDKVATAGSCFAQHISKRLIDSGFSWLNLEPAPKDMSLEQASDLGYGVYSARYGNIYTSGQLVQLFQRAFSLEDFEREPWVGKNGLIDPFRPYVQSRGFASREEFFEDLEKHLAAVRQIFLDLDVFIFTLGLTESWVRKSDSAVVPFHPGVLGASVGADDYIFKNQSVMEVNSDLLLFRSMLKKVNPGARVLITVSPVPLIATYSKGHVLPQTVYSKSVLRVAAEEFSQSFDDVAYFPSYEIISSHYNRGAYYKDDLREVDSRGVDHVMRLMLKHYTRLASSLDDSYSEVSLVCDEDNLDV